MLIISRLIPCMCTSLQVFSRDNRMLDSINYPCLLLVNFDRPSSLFYASYGLEHIRSRNVLKIPFLPVPSPLVYFFRLEAKHFCESAYPVRVKFCIILVLSLEDLTLFWLKVEALRLKEWLRSAADRNRPVLALSLCGLRLILLIKLH